MLVTLRAGRAKQPMYLFPGADGGAQGLARLVSRIKVPRSIIGVEPFDCDAEGRPPATVEAMAEQATLDVRKHQSKGPYRLVGYGFGGLVALEVARRLRAAGARVASLCLIDTLFDHRHWPLRARLGRYSGDGETTGVGDVPQEAMSTPCRQSLCAAALAGYVPTPFVGPVTLFTSGGQNSLAAKLWEPYVKGLTVRPVADDETWLGSLAAGLTREGLETNPDKRYRPPRVLLATSATWLNAARLALSLSEAGFRVEAVCLNRHSLAKVGFVERIYPFKPLRPFASLQAAISRAKPDLIIPCDDQVAAMLHRLFAAADPATKEGASLRVLIERSLGDAENLGFLFSRDWVMRVAGEECLRHPETAVISDHAALRDWLEERGFPAVLKTDGSWGGEGVAIVRNHEEAARAFARLRSYPNPFRIVKRLLVKGDSGPLMDRLARRSPVVSIQTFEPGRPGNAAVACMDGKVLAAVYVEVIRSKGETGPASVVRVIDHPEMAYAVETMVQRLGLSGFVGFDFILDPGNGGASLIELNPRATPTCHLPTVDGLDLAAALSASLRHRPGRKANVALGSRIVALFPQEMLRDSSSGFLLGAHHDVPWQSPELVALGMQAARRRPFRLPRLQRFNRGSGLLKA